MMYNNKKCDMNVWALLLGALLLFVYFTNNLCRTRTEFFENERGNVIEDAWAQLRERAETMYGRDGDVSTATTTTPTGSPKGVRFEGIPSSKESASPSPPPPPAPPSSASSIPSPYARYLPYAAWTAQGEMRKEWDRPQECAKPPTPPPTVTPPNTRSPSDAASVVPFPAGQMAAAMARMRTPTLAPSPIVPSTRAPTITQSPRMMSPSTATTPSFVEEDEEEEYV